MSINNLHSIEFVNIDPMTITYRAEHFLVCFTIIKRAITVIFNFITATVRATRITNVIQEHTIDTNLLDLNSVIKSQIKPLAILENGYSSHVMLLAIRNYFRGKCEEPIITFFANKRMSFHELSPTFLGEFNLLDLTEVDGIFPNVLDNDISSHDDLLCLISFCYHIEEKVKNLFYIMISLLSSYLYRQEGKKEAHHSAEKTE